MELTMKKTLSDICKGIGKIIFSQGLFVIIIIIITSIICSAVKNNEVGKITNKTSKSELK